MFPKFRTNSRLRKYGFARKRYIQYESYNITSLDAKFHADFEFEVQILFLPTHSREKRVLRVG